MRLRRAEVAVELDSNDRDERCARVGQLELEAVRQAALDLHLQSSDGSWVGHRSSGGSERSLDLLHAEGLDHVVHADVAEVAEQRATLEARTDLVGFVLLAA